MTKAKKFTYRIQYIDNTYQMVDWTKAEFDKVGRALEDGKSGVTLNEGIFRLSDIRAIVYIPPIPEPTEEEKKLQKEHENELSEWGFVDPESAKWLKSQGIDVGGVI